MTVERQALIRALARVHGSLAEIGTVWRRAARQRPDLPLARPARLADSVRELMATVACDPAAVPDRLAALERDLAAAAALTCGPGIPPVGDARLWAYAGEGLVQARELAFALARLPLAS